jgi:hypothetical protein
MLTRMRCNTNPQRCILDQIQQTTLYTNDQDRLKRCRRYDRMMK